MGADGTLTMDKSTRWNLLSGQQSAEQLLTEKKLETTGDVTFLSYLAGLFEKPSGMFNIVLP